MASIISKTRQGLYGAQSTLGDLIPISEGNVRGFLDRIARKQLLRQSGKFLFFPGAALAIAPLARIFPRFGVSRRHLFHNYHEAAAMWRAVADEKDAEIAKDLDNWLWEVGELAVSKYMVNPGGRWFPGSRAATSQLDLGGGTKVAYRSSLFIYGRTKLIPGTHPRLVTIRRGRIANSLVRGGSKSMRIHSIKVSKAKGTVEYRKGSKWPHAAIQERGGPAKDSIGQIKVLPPRPFMAPALRDKAPELKAITERAVQNLWNRKAIAHNARGIARDRRTNPLSRILRRARFLTFRGATRLGDINALRNADVLRIWRRQRTRIIQGAVGGRI